jgi:hypothetical protein
MMKCIRGILVAAILMAPFAALAPSVRADDVDMTDYNTYWKVATDPTPPDPSLDYNTYWAEVQAKQQWQDRQDPPPAQVQMQ